MGKCLKLLPLLTVSAAALIAGWAIQQERNAAGARLHPSIEVDRELQLGEQELQSTVEASVFVRNRGGQPLIIDEIETKCGCLGVFAATESGAREKVVRLEIPLRGTRTLVPRLAVVGRPGVPEIRKFSFRTNDPQNRTVEIAMRVTPIARYFAAPSEVNLGTVLVGEHAERKIEIKALERRLPPVQRATSSSDRIRLDYRPAEGAADADLHANTSELMGRLTVHFDALSIPGDIGGAVSLFCEGRQEPVLIIPITGRVAHLVELTPQNVLLPRVSHSGPIYTATCLCRAGLSEPFNLSIRKLPAGVSVHVRDVPENSSLKMVQIDASHLQEQIPRTGLATHIGLVAEIDGRHIPLTLTLNIQHREVRPGGRP